MCVKCVGPGWEVVAVCVCVGVFLSVHVDTHVVCVCVSAIVLLNSSHTSGSVSGGSGRELKEVVQ